jgi:hypothetical protein
MKEWQATFAGKMYKEWQMSPAGKKVYASAAKLNKYIRDSSNIEAIVTSLSLPPGSRLGFGVMIKIDREDYILAFGSLPPSKDATNELEQLHSLKVNDKIMIRSRVTSHAPKYANPIIIGDYIK